MKAYITNYLNYINDLMTEYRLQEDALKSDDRKDESILFKVRGNICDIFSKMVNASDKKVSAMKLGNDEEMMKAFNEDYLNWFEKIPQSWKTNLELARKFDDVIVMKTEEVKLETANLLKNKFLELIEKEED